MLLPHSDHNDNQIFKEKITAQSQKLSHQHESTAFIEELLKFLFQYLKERFVGKY